MRGRTRDSMDQRFDAVKVQGLAQTGRSPEMKDLFFLGVRDKTRNQSHRDLAEMPDPLQDFLPIHEGHRGIKKNEIIIVILDLPEPFLAVQGAIHLVAFMLKGLAELLTDHFFVVDDQQFSDGNALH